MQLEIKHLAPYLPYGVWMQIIDYPFKGTNSRRLLELDCGHDFHLHLKQGNVRLELRPLSDLSKEIEVNGERFIPIMVMFGGADYAKYDYNINIIDKPILGKYIQISVKDLGDPCISFGLKNINNNMLNLDNWELLFKWHFDVFNLIENGLAVDVNTLNLNP